MNTKGCVMAYGTLEPDSPGIPRPPSAPARPLETQEGKTITHIVVVSN